MPAPAPPRFLIAPLDWGMGHATRSLALAAELRRQGARVTLAVAAGQRHLVEGWGFAVVEARGYGVRYFAGMPPVASLALQLPRFLLAMLRERRGARRLARSLCLDAIVSDNRPMFRSRRCLSVYVTHQVSVPAPRPWGAVLSAAHRFFINRFDICLVPDTDGSRLAGGLSAGGRLRVPRLFAGPMSRFAALAPPARPLEERAGYDLLVVVAGPEPFRGRWGRGVVAALRRSPGRFAVVGLAREASSAGVDVFGHLPSADFAALARRSRAIYALAGYTTVMDAAALGRPLIMTPTPGQWEQERLCRHLAAEPGFYPVAGVAQALRLLAGDLRAPDPALASAPREAARRLVELASRRGADSRGGRRLTVSPPAPRTGAKKAAAGAAAAGIEKNRAGA